jgi:hypothetical protein
VLMMMVTIDTWMENPYQHSTDYHLAPTMSRSPVGAYVDRVVMTLPVHFYLPYLWTTFKHMHTVYCSRIRRKGALL